MRAVEEAAYAEARPARGRALARAGGVGGDHGRARAGSGRGRGRRRRLDGRRSRAGARRGRRVGASSRRSPPRPAGSRALLAGDLPLGWSSTPRRPASSCCPTAASSGSACTCAAWIDPCPHALAVLYQLAWLVDADPFVLLQLRGLARDELLPGCTRAGPTAGGESHAGPSSPGGSTAAGPTLATWSSPRTRPYASARLLRQDEPVRRRCDRRGRRPLAAPASPSASSGHVGQQRRASAASGSRPLWGVELISPKAACAIARARGLQAGVERRSWAAQTSTYSRCSVRTRSRASAAATPSRGPARRSARGAAARSRRASRPAPRAPRAGRRRRRPARGRPRAAPR